MNETNPPVVVDLWPPHVCLNSSLIGGYVSNCVGEALGVGLGDVIVEAVECLPRRLKFTTPLGSHMRPLPPPTYASVPEDAVVQRAVQPDSCSPSRHGHTAKVTKLVVVDDDPMRLREAAADGARRKAWPSARMLQALGQVLSTLAESVERGDHVEIDKGRWLAAALEKYNPGAPLARQVEACRQMTAQQQAIAAVVQPPVSPRARANTPVAAPPASPKPPVRSNASAHSGPSSPIVEGCEAAARQATEYDVLMEELAAEQSRLAEWNQTVQRTRTSIAGLQDELHGHKFETDAAVLRAVMLEISDRKKKIVDEIAGIEKEIDTIADDVDAKIEVLQRQAAAVRKTLGEAKS